MPGNRNSSFKSEILYSSRNINRNKKYGRNHKAITNEVSVLEKKKRGRWTKSQSKTYSLSMEGTFPWPISNLDQKKHIDTYKIHIELHMIPTKKTGASWTYSPYIEHFD